MTETESGDRDPISLAPLTPEEALRALLAVDPDDPRAPDPPDRVGQEDADEDSR